MNHYETVFILTPVLSDVQMKEAVDKFKDVITSNAGTILIEFDANPDMVKKLETQFRRDERVLRFLTFRLDKYAHEYAIKRRSLKGAKQNSQPEEVKED